MDDKYELPGHVLARSVGEDTVLLDLEQDEYYSLDRVGTRVLDLIRLESTVGQIIETISGEYGVERERIETDVRSLLGELVASGLVREKR